MRLLVVVVTGLLAACSGDDAAPPPSTEQSTTTAPPTPAEVLCESLGTDDYETRKQSLTEFRAAESDGSVPCAPLVTDLESAIEIESRASAFTAEVITPTVSSCEPTSMTTTFENTTDAALGFAAAIIRHENDDGSNQIGTSFVDWSIPAGATIEETTFIGATGSPDCRLSGFAFVADDSAVDASIPGDIADDDQASDDPELWFPALLARGDEWRKASDPSGVAYTEDIRSADYSDLVAAAADEPSPLLDRPRRSKVCRVVRGPTDDYLGLLYASEAEAYSYVDEAGETIDVEESSSTRFGVFRRGADGRWRWLIRFRTVQPKPCSSPTELLDTIIDSGIVDLPEGIDSAEDLENLSDDEREALFEDLRG